MKKIILLALITFISCSNESETLNESVQLNTNEQEGDVLSNNKVYDSMPEMNIDISKKYSAVIKTSMGDMSIDFFTEDAPLTVNNFINLSRDGYYDNVIFHRVISGFMIQGGDPNSKDNDRSNDGQGGPGYTINAEFSQDLTHKRGILSMARAQDPNSAGSQFFIVVADSNFLDRQYSIFGEVIEGMDVVDKIVNVERDGMDNPLEKVAMKVTIRS